ncbi:hypothetical protein PR048_013801 [Dryococelus australis]|uniref:Uncharacterized protein n=1 Tax=Dryococelus australis TaxID=614101 RepID=A0ABQ9HT81_9NEOP|nr:hypothetical protein PR048_013801 [Dryococelus australis]
MKDSRVMKESEMKELYDNKGKFKFLGLEISCHDNIMEISQRKLIDTVLSKFNMTDHKHSDIPMEPKLHIEPIFQYHILAKFQNCYDTIHFKYLKHALRYMYKTKDLCLIYGKSDGSVIDTFVDADFANDRHDRKSVTGFFIRVFGNNIIWGGKKTSMCTPF